MGERELTVQGNKEDSLVARRSPARRAPPSFSRPSSARLPAILGLLIVSLVPGFLAGPSLARASDFRVTVEGDSLALLVRADVGPRILPDFVRERLDRGIPATIGLQADLYQKRSAWFDNRIDQVIQRYRLSRDAWSGTYVLEGPNGAFGADSLGTLIRRIGEEPIELPVRRDLGRSDAVRWVEITAVTIPLSVQDLGEVEEWITGEIGGGSGSIFGIPGGLLRIVRDLSGLGDRRLVGRSRRFQMSLIAGDVFWVQKLDE